MNGLKKCEYSCRNKKTCTLPIFFELLAMDNICECNECIVKPKCVSPCNIFRNAIAGITAQTLATNPSLINRYVQYRKEYLQSLGGMPSEGLMIIPKHDGSLTPSKIKIDLKPKEFLNALDERYSSNYDLQQYIIDSEIKAKLSSDPINKTPNKLTSLKIRMFAMGLLKEKKQLKRDSL